MKSQASEIQALFERLEMVEKQNRRMKRAGLVLLVAVSAFLTMAEARNSRIVEASRFVLRDSSGKMRGELTVSKDGPELNLYDISNRKRAELEVNNFTGQPILSFYNAHGEELASLLQSGITFSNNHYAAIVDVSSKSATITVDRSLAYKDNIQIQVGDKGVFERLIDGNEYQVRLGETDLGRIETGATHHTSAASILLFDSRGHVIWQAP